MLAICKKVPKITEWIKVKNTLLNQHKTIIISKSKTQKTLTKFGKKNRYISRMNYINYPLSIECTNNYTVGYVPNMNNLYTKLNEHNKATIFSTLTLARRKVKQQCK